MRGPEAFEAELPLSSLSACPWLPDPSGMDELPSEESPLPSGLLDWPPSFDCWFPLCLMAKLMRTGVCPSLKVCKTFVAVFAAENLSKLVDSDPKIAQPLMHLEKLIDAH